MEIFTCQCIMIIIISSIMSIIDPLVVMNVVKVVVILKVKLVVIWEVTWDWSSWARERPHEVRKGGGLRIDVFHTFWANQRPAHKPFFSLVDLQRLQNGLVWSKSWEIVDAQPRPPCTSCVSKAQRCMRRDSWARSQLNSKQKVGKSSMRNPPPCALLWTPYREYLKPFSKITYFK